MGKVGRSMSWGEAPTTHPLHWLIAQVAAMPPSPRVGYPMGNGQKGTCWVTWIPSEAEHLTFSIHRAEEAGGSHEKGCPSSPR